MFYYFCVIYSNFFLYKYLQTMTENNKAIKETDKKKNRKRNFIPAQASIMCAVVMVISYVVFAVLYSVPVSPIEIYSISCGRSLSEPAGRRQPSFHALDLR